MKVVMLRPAWYYIAPFAALGVAWSVAMLFGVIAAGRDPWQVVVGIIVLILAIVVSYQFLVLFYVRFTSALIEQKRFFGLGDRTVQIADVTSVGVIFRKNWLGMNVALLRISWPGGLMQFQSSVYRESSLNKVVDLLQTAGAPVANEARRHFRSKSTSAVRTNTPG